MMKAHLVIYNVYIYIIYINIIRGGKGYPSGHDDSRYNSTYQVSLRETFSRTRNPLGFPADAAILDIAIGSLCSSLLM